MPTHVIATSGGDFSTPQLWEDNIPADLTTGGMAGQYIGELNNEEFAISAAIILDIDSHTTDATHDIILRCQTGESFRDDAAIQSNALRYNGSSGARIKNTSTTASSYCLRINNTQHVKVQGVQFRHAGNTGGSASVFRHTNGTQATNIFEWCIFEQDFGDFNRSIVELSPCTFRNNLVVCKSTGGPTNLATTGSVKLRSCTIVRCSDASGTSNNILFANGGYPTMKNCAVFGGSGPSHTGAGWDTANCTNNGTDLASGSFDGMTTNIQASLTFANQFQNAAFGSVGSPTHDFRLKTGAALIDNGVTDSTDGTPDIANTTRPSGSAYDIGCWEFVAGGGATTPFVPNNDNQPVFERPRMIGT